MTAAAGRGAGRTHGDGDQKIVGVRVPGGVLTFDVVGPASPSDNPGDRPRGSCPSVDENGPDMLA